MKSGADLYFEKAESWHTEFAALRRIALDCQLSEELKWGHPCYTLAGRNVLLIHGFKGYCAYLFFKGALMKDPQRLLIQQTEHVQAARQIRFRNIDEIKERAAILKGYIRDAIAIEHSGTKVKMKKTAAYAVPKEFQVRLKRSARLRKAFSALTPGRQRAYILHIGGAKLSATRAERVARCLPRIMAGKGLDD